MSDPPPVGDPPRPTVIRANLLVLAVAQALGLSGMSMMVFIGGIVGRQLAPSASLATLPVALAVIGLASATVPGAFLSRRIGRRLAFVLGAAVAAAAALLLYQAVASGSFSLFCAGAAVLGVNGAFVQQYRFAAAESAPQQFAGRAVSLVLIGGIVGGVLGPEVARRTRGLTDEPFAGSFLALAALLLLSILVLSRLRRTEAGPVPRSPGQEAAPATAGQSAFAIAVLSAAVGYVVMSSVMTATPLHLRENGFDIDQSALIIQSHVVAMYLPSLASGYIMDRLGVPRVVIAGVVGMAAAVVVGATASTFAAFWAALVLLGLGWNFMFLGGTVLLARSAAGPDRFRLQAINDFSVFGAQALASLSAGTALALVGWQTLNLALLPAIGVVALAVAFRRRSLRAAPVA